MLDTATYQPTFGAAGTNLNVAIKETIAPGIGAEGVHDDHMGDLQED